MLSTRIIRNDKGEVISGIKILRKREYGTGNISSSGEEKVNWNLLSQYADNDGFDIRNVEENKAYKMKVKLPYGTKLIRYGNDTGRFSAPKGTRYDELALPYEQDTVEYNEYMVITQEVSVICIVYKGKVAPGFGSEGGGIQYLHPMTMRESIRSGILERIN